jgi:plasmid maintenance system antidote protein VapI
VKQRHGISADTAARPARHSGGAAASWLALQAQYDLETLPTRDEIERRVAVRDRESV